MDPARPADAVAKTNTGGPSTSPEPMLLDRERLAELARKLPPFPVCAADVIRAARRGSIDAESVIRLASSDQVLAGRLLECANSAAYAWSGNVRTIPQAVMYLGEDRATQVLLSAALKPILSVAGHHQLWEHSLEAAHVAHRIASTTTAIHPSDAYVLGLLHDVGLLLFRTVPRDAASSVEAQVRAGCDRTTAELTTYGVTHEEAGAEVLRHWKMPQDFVAAVAYHHHPEAGGGAGAALLYLAEQWTDPDGDPPCDGRVEQARQALGLTSEGNIMVTPQPANPNEQHFRR